MHLLSWRFVSLFKFLNHILVVHRSLCEPSQNNDHCALSPWYRCFWISCVKRCENILLNLQPYFLFCYRGDGFMGCDLFVLPKKKNLCQCFDNFLLMHEHFDPYFTMSLYKRDFFSMFCIVLNFLDLCIKTYFIFHMLDLSPGIWFFFFSFLAWLNKELKLKQIFVTIMSVV